MNTEPTVRDIIDTILKKRNMGYAYALGTVESMLKEVLIRFATPEQSAAWIKEQLEIQEKLGKK